MPDDIGWSTTLDASIRRDDTVTVAGRTGYWTVAWISEFSWTGHPADKPTPPLVRVFQTTGGITGGFRTVHIDAYPPAVTLVRHGNIDDDVCDALEAFTSAPSHETRVAAGDRYEALRAARAAGRVTLDVAALR